MSPHLDSVIKTYCTLHAGCVQDEQFMTANETLMQESFHLDYLEPVYVSSNN